MASHEQIQQTGQPEAPAPRERPWLLPYNRKLRHLQGITIRNLTLTTIPSRSRGKTIDDEAIPSTLKSPTKALALRENKGLTHSRSSSDLKSNEGVARRSNGELRDLKTPTRTSRPAVGKGPRRRMTMEWSSASPLTRQKKLEDITLGRMADTFFSLHVVGQESPIYISETAEKAMNPNFKFFDLGPCGPRVTRLDKLTVRVWARSETMPNWQYLMEYTVLLRSLQFIGKTLGRFKHPLPQNCILFHMTDGIYTSFTDLPVQERTRPELLAPPKMHPDGRTLPSSSYDALMRLSTLDDCIQDALTTRDRIADEIESILALNRDPICTVEQVPESEESLKTVQAAIASEKRRLVAVRRRRDELQANIKDRRSREQNPDPTRSVEDLAIDKDLLSQHQSQINVLEKAIEAKTLLETRDHYITRSVLPPALKKTLPTPFSLEGISVQWADMQDALYAAGQWPELIEHETLALNDVRGEVALLSADEFEIEKGHEVGRIIRALQGQEELSYDSSRHLVEPELEPEQRKGVFKYLPDIKNPFKSATA